MAAEVFSDHNQLIENLGDTYDSESTSNYIETLRHLLGEEPAQVHEALILLGGLEIALQANNASHTALVARNTQLTKMLEISHIDVEVTGLPNRKAFDDALRHWGQDSRHRLSGEEKHRHVTQARMNKTLIILDLNNFKLINDVLGWEQGDRALKIIAELLKKSIGFHDDVYRYAGDEFAILANHPHEIQSRDITTTIERSFNNNLNILRNISDSTQWNHFLPECTLDDPKDREAVHVVGAHFGSANLPPDQSYGFYDRVVKSILQHIRSEKESLAVR